MTTELARTKYIMTSVDLKLEYNPRSGRKEGFVKIPKGSQLERIFDQRDQWDSIKTVWKTPVEQAILVEIKLIEDWEEFDEHERPYVGSFLDWTGSASHLFVDSDYWKEEEEK